MTLRSGFGKFGVAAGGGGPGVAQFTVNQYNTSGASPSVTTYTEAVLGTEYKFTTAGYYLVTITDGSEPVTFDMWAWGAGGGNYGAPLGPSAAPYIAGGAGGGVRGRHTFTAPNTFTFTIGAGGGPVNGGWPDGGNSTADGYPNAGGGGSSRIGEGTIPFATIDATPNTFLLIGGAGGGGSNYIIYYGVIGGVLGGSGGYPGGFPGGGYYPDDGAGAVGGGGTQSAGGAAGTGGRQGSGTAGGKYSGGPGNSGAGGGGYYGGGGAMGYYAIGGGGSSYINPTLSNTADFDTSPGPTHNIAVSDPGNAGIKPGPAGNSNSSGAISLKLISYGD